MFPRLRWLRALVGIAAFSCASSALGVPPTIATKMACQTLPQVVLCAVHLDANPGATVKWAEAEFVEVPAFVKPVRQKATFKASPTKRPPIYLGLTPARGGKGEIGVMVRAVACGDDGLEACTHVTKRLQATITVPPK